MRVFARLVVMSGEAGGLLYLRPGRYLIGRQFDCDLVIAGPDISRRHAVIEIDQTSARVIDQGSRNGTRIDGIAVARADLAHGTLIQFGSTTCVFEHLDAAAQDGDEPTPACPTRSGSKPELTPAQEKVLVYLLSGLSEKAIAVKFGLSRNTVHNHVKQIYVAFHVNSRAELLAQFVRRGGQVI
jgi:S-DNA-T family DNA segregation ATPase FtsK/SpoIIIE